MNTGAGVDAAVEGCRVVIHAATDSGRHAREIEPAGARTLAAAARSAGAHLLYVSIVGVDRHRLPYYRAKYAAEQVVADSGADWTVLRATQFHDLIDLFLRRGLFLRTRHMRFQPVDAAEVAARLTELAAGPPLGLAPDFGGPEVLGIRDLVDIRREVTGQRTRLVVVPAVRFLADYDAGRHLTPEHRAGTRTWRQWLVDRGSITG
jgi:uncharacterized protein YbjT (DUF2867 family)